MSIQFRQVCISILLLYAFLLPVHGQVLTNISSDGTLGTAVTQIGNVHTIEGGTIRGLNQFHSFEHFSVGTGDIAAFNGPVGIENILSRVTGGLHSDIDGELHSSIEGANLYLLNPAGVFFGPNAALNLSGSFYVSTADLLKFQDGAEFHAVELGQDNTVLSAAPVEAFGFLSSNPNGVTINQSVLTVSEGKTLSVSGGNIEVHGNPLLTPLFIPTLRAPGGQVQLVGMNSPGEIILNQQGTELQQVSAAQVGEIVLASDTLIDVSGIPEVFGGTDRGGGTVVIRSGRLTIDNARIFSNTRGNMNGAPTAIDLQATNDVIIKNRSLLSISTAIGAGKAGDITVLAENVNISDGAVLSNITNGPGDAGIVKITATENVTLSGTDPSSPRPSGLFSTSTNFVFDAGGNIIGVLDDVGDAGGVIVTAKNVLITDGGIIDSSTLGSGNGGPITIRANEKMTLAGFRSTSIGTFSSGIRSISGGTGDASDILIDAKNVTVADTAIIDSSTIESGDGGSITMTASETVTLSDLGPLDRSDLPGGLFSETRGTGSGGEITIQATKVNISARVEVSAQSTGIADAGDINITAGDSISLNETTISTAANQASGGNIKLTADQGIQLRDSTIEVKVGGNELTTGGTINLDPQFITLQNSQLLATAVSGTGGTIELIGNVILMDPFSSINASSQFGVNGSVNIQAPIQNLSGTISPLPDDILRVSTMMTARCAAQKGGQLSSFIKGGRDTLPLEPEDFLSSPTFLENPGRVAEQSTNLSTLPMGHADPFNLSQVTSTFGQDSSFLYTNCTS